jgi:hypothetical protein
VTDNCLTYYILPPFILEQIIGWSAWKRLDSTKLLFFYYKLLLQLVNVRLDYGQLWMYAIDLLLDGTTRFS